MPQQAYYNNDGCTWNAFFCLKVNIFKLAVQEKVKSFLLIMPALEHYSGIFHFDS